MNIQISCALGEITVRYDEPRTSPTQAKSVVIPPA